MSKQFHNHFRGAFLCLSLFAATLLVWLLFGLLQGIEPIQAQEEEIANELETQRRSLTQAYVTNDVELGDVDSDGDLDLLLVNEAEPRLIIYLNNNGVYNEIMDWTPEQLVGSPTDAAWGDADGDGDLDLAVAVWGGNRPHYVFRNENGKLNNTPDFITTIPQATDGRYWDAHTVAWGDLDGDGKLDLIFGHGRVDPAIEANARITRVTQANVIYQNTFTTEVQGPQLTFKAVWTSTTKLPTRDIALADADGDGDLDIAVANGDLSVPPRAFTNTIYINQLVPAGEPFTFDEQPIIQTITGTSVASSRSIAWAHLVEKAGEETQLPELVVGNIDTASEIFCNEAPANSPPQLVRCWDSTQIPNLAADGNLQASHIAIADINNNQQLDLAIGRFNQPNIILCGERTNEISFYLCWNSNKFGLNLLTQRLIVGDVNGDGQLDLVEGNGGGANIEQTSFIYENIGSILTFEEMIFAASEVNDISSAALGDLDSDGDLDLIIARTGAREGKEDSLYFNIDGELFEETPLVLEGSEDTADSRTLSIALADIDNNDNFVLAVGRGAQDSRGNFLPIENAIYRIVSSTQDVVVNFELLWPSPSGFSNPSEALTMSETQIISGVTTSVAWGDMNGDGYLDLAVGNRGNRPDSKNLNIGEFNQVLLYIPEDERFSEEASWRSPEPRQTSDLAWGDVDNDGDLDLAVANINQPNELFINEGGKLSSTSKWMPNGRSYSTELSFADINGDGLLDLIVANGIQDALQNTLLYLNYNGNFAAEPDWSSESLPAGNVAVADVDNDGDIDVALGTYSTAGNKAFNHLYLNDGGVLRDDSIKWVLATNVVRLSSGLRNGDLLFGDLDNDGDVEIVDLFWGQGEIEKRIITNAHFTNAQHSIRPSIHIKQIGAANFYSDTIGLATIPFELSDILDSELLSITAYYSLNGGGEWVLLDGQVKLEADGQPVDDSLQSDTPYLYTFDPIVNRLLGRSDNFVVRLVATPYTAEQGTLEYGNIAPKPVLYASSATTSAPFRIDGRRIRIVDANAQPASSAIVFRHENENELFKPYANEFSETEEILNFRDAESVYHTDGQGFLQGRGAIDVDDRLFALWPVPVGDLTAQHNITTLIGSEANRVVIAPYYTTHPANASGVDSASVDAEPTITLTVNTSNKLYLFNLDVSLEWDASSEPLYLERLEQDIRRASAILYDLTDGQMALGEINIYMNKERWRASHIQVYASNRYRPNADLGGIVSRPISLTLGMPEADVPIANSLVLSNANSDIYETRTITNAIQPGYIRMPASWNRFGEIGIEEGEDWARTLAHELGHYLLFLPDNYLLAQLGTGYLLEVNNNNPCVPSAMTTAYANTTDANSELLDEFKQGLCDNVLAASLTGLSDWEIVTAIYGIEPLTTTEDGPRRLPLAVTQVNQPEIETPEFVDPFLFVDKGDGTTELLSPRTVSSYLIRASEPRDVIIPLGAPIGNQIRARGAKLGDELCVYDSGNLSQSVGARSACDEITEEALELAFTDVNWTPIVDVSLEEIPEDADFVRPFPTTLNIEVSLFDVEGQPFDAQSIEVQIFPNLVSDEEAYNSVPITLTNQDGVWRTEPNVDLRDIPIDGYVRVWINGNDVAQQLVPFFLGGGWLPDDWALGPDDWALGPDDWALGVGPTAGWNAPVSSGDGQLTIFNICSAFDKAPTYELQALPIVPNLPSWLVPVGSAYQIEIEATHEFDQCSQSDTAVTSLLFNYLERDLPNRSNESALRIYFWDEAATSWQPLENTTQNTELNLVSGAFRSNAIYVLGMTSEIPLLEGWNLIGYPWRQPQSIDEMIEPISDSVSLIYGYAYNNGESEFQVYCPATVVDEFDWPSPDSATNSIQLVCEQGNNDNGLTDFEFGYGYWIYATSETTLRLPVDVIGNGVATHSGNSATNQIPAYYQGTFLAANDEDDWTGATLTAWVDEKACGETTVYTSNQQHYFTLLVHAKQPDTEEPCAAVGDQLAFTINGTQIAETGTWDNRIVQNLQLTAPVSIQRTASGIWLLGIVVFICCGLLVIQKRMRLQLLK